MPIIWLASYPKSGNTWTRAFLANYLAGQPQPVNINDLPNFTFGEHQRQYFEHLSGKPLADLAQEEINDLRPEVQRYVARLTPETIFVKTHSAVTELNGVPTILGEVTQGAVYIIRNPLDVALSYSDHLGVDLDEAIGAMGNSDNQLATTDNFVFQVLGSWSDHVLSWTAQQRTLIRVLRYEDMLRKTEATFGDLVRALKMPVDKARLRRAIEFSSFRTLRAMEDRLGFVERSLKSEKFFRKGRVGEWRTELSSDQVARIVDDHREMMTRFGYVDRRGNPVDGGPMPKAT